MIQGLLAIHLVTALIIIGLVLMQQGKGAEAGASFGAGASQTFFGSSGSWNFFSRMTAVFATIFFLTSIALAIAAKNQATVADPNLPRAEQTEFPRAPGEAETPADEIPAPEGNGATGAIPAAPADRDGAGNSGIPTEGDNLAIPEPDRESR